MSAQERIKRVLSAIESLRKELLSLDECGAEADGLRNVLAAKQQELTETESRLAKLKKEIGEADAQFSLWRTVNAKEVARGNQEVDELHGKIDVLEAEIAERRKQSDNIVAGIKSLNERLKI
jgi:peptidoglycan hydrolase CwlO-like protein